MPTFSVSGKRQQTITQTYVVETDDPAPAIALFKSKYAGLTGVRATRKKDVTVIAPEPVAAVIVSAKKKAAKK